MTSIITVNAHAGWPIKVISFNPKTGEQKREVIVQPKTTEDFFVYDEGSLTIHEMRKEEK